MGRYDISLKKSIKKDFLEVISGVLGFEDKLQKAQELNVELAPIKEANNAVDILYLCNEMDPSDPSKDFLIQIELQLRNDPRMPIRMSDYSNRIFDIHGMIPLRQICLYIGNQMCTMQDHLPHIPADKRFGYHLVNIKDIPYQLFLQKPETSIFAVLGKINEEDDKEQVIMQSIKNVQESDIEDKEFYQKHFVLFTDLRKLLNKTIIKKIKTMFDIPIEEYKDTFLYQEGVIEGKKAGVIEGKKQGVIEGKKAGVIEGKKQGVIEGKIEIAAALLKNEFDPAIVCQLTGLSMDKVMTLLKK